VRTPPNDVEVAVIAYLDEHPQASANACAAELGYQRSKVLEAVRAVRQARKRRATRQNGTEGRFRRSWPPHPPLISAIRELLAADEDLTADAIARKLRRRRKNVGAAVRAVKAEKETEAP
jgi:hypothetical protein